MRKKPQRDFTGLRFGRLVALSYISSARWRCLCDCGATTTVETGNLKKGHIRSCGCLQRETLGAHRITHGRTASLTFTTWAAMRKRCGNPNAKNYHLYGGRGIRVCERWQAFTSFLADMGERPSKRHSIERVDNNGHYEPGNCVWATERQQSNNKRTNIVLDFNGRRQSAAQWARELGVRKTTLYERLNHGWSVERTLSTPTGRYGQRK